MNDFKEFPNYTILSCEQLNDINSLGYVLEHNKTGCRIYIIQNDDENKTFTIGFRTPPTDSTGVPHILEHSVLCGSQKYPVKDAMTEVSKGSLNTFMNAFTYPDRTLYPVASCNNKDFFNLTGVYLDAVFAPRVYENDNIFKQEGWHYEMEDCNSDLTLNGVVYNEMKGIYSQPSYILSYFSRMSLFPDNQYGVISGGDPDYIPDLSYEQFLDFHKTLYHPSNSAIFLYGDMDYEKMLSFIDEEYLCKYDRLSTDTHISYQKPFDKMKIEEYEYSVGEDEPLSDATYLSYNVVCCDVNDILTMEALSVIDEVLCSIPGARLKEKLIEAGIGKDISSSYDSEIMQPTFSIIAENANYEDKEKFIKIIEDTLREIIRDGFDKKSLEGSITSAEFSYREADFGSYPKGIIYAMSVFDRINYTDDDPFLSFKESEIYTKLHELVKTDYFEKLVERVILNNNHKSVVIMKPSKTVGRYKEEALKNKLSDLRESLSKDEIANIVKATHDLKEYQSSEDTAEALKTIPTLSLDDIEREIKPVDYSFSNDKGFNEISVPVSSNGILYFILSINMSVVPYELIPAVTFLKILLGYINTEKYSYKELTDEINIYTGGVSFNAIVNKDRNDADKFTASFEIKTKVLYKNVNEALNLLYEILLKSDFSDKKRIKDVLEETKTRIQSYNLSNGHSVAVGRVLSQFSKASKLIESINGIDEYHYICDFLDNYDDRIDSMIDMIKKVQELLYNRNLFTIVCGCEKSTIKNNLQIVSSFVNRFEAKSYENKLDVVKPQKASQALTYSSMISFDCKGTNFIKNGLLYNGKLAILRNILNNDYLWTEVRLKNGAYGVWISISRNGDLYLVSYRDPEITKTYDVFDKTAQYLENYPLDEELTQRYIISAIGDLEQPLTPSMQITKAYSMWQSKLTNENLQSEKDDLLSTTSEDVRKLAEYVKLLNTDGYICTVGSETKISENKNLFTKIYSLN